jgi:hypothetical protein
MTLLNHLSEQALAELLVVLAAMLWVVVRLLNVVAKRLEEGKAINVKVGKDHVIILGGKLPIQPEKGKTAATKGSDTRKRVSLIFF